MNVGLCHWITCFLGCVITGIAIVCDSSYCVLLDNGIVFFFFFLLSTEVYDFCLYLQ